MRSEMPPTMLFERGTTRVSAREYPLRVGSMSCGPDSATPNLIVIPRSHQWNLVAISGDREGKAVHG